MTDKITKCIAHKKIGDDSLIDYAVVYWVENGGQVTTLTVTVTPAEMTDPLDLDELKTLANVKAAADKAIWITDTSDDPYDILDDTLNGDVTL